MQTDLEKNEPKKMFLKNVLCSQIRQIWSVQYTEMKQWLTNLKWKWSSFVCNFEWMSNIQTYNKSQQNQRRAEAPPTGHKGFPGGRQDPVRPNCELLSLL